MRIQRLVLASSLALGLAACGGSDGADQVVASPPDTSAAPTSSTSSAPQSPESDAPASDPEPSGEATMLIGTIGTPEDPEDFEIGLMTEDGEEVTELPAGDYVIEVDDQSRIHNWHLTGPGGIDEATGVSELEKRTFEVTLEPGDYDYVCDPHTGLMSESFTVT